MKRFFRFLKRLWAWIPILWKDEDWDPSFLFRIMQFKISRMRKIINKNDYHTCAQMNCREMKIAEMYLDRLANDHIPYQNKYFCTCPDSHFQDRLDGCTDIVFCAACRDFLGIKRSDYIKRRKAKRKTYGHPVEELMWQNFCKHFLRHARKWWD